MAASNVAAARVAMKLNYFHLALALCALSRPAHAQSTSESQTPSKPVDLPAPPPPPPGAALSPPAADDAPARLPAPAPPPPSAHGASELGETESAEDAEPVKGRAAIARPPKQAETSPQFFPVERPARRWYGWQTLTSDAASLSVTAIGLAVVVNNLSSESGGTSIGAGLVVIGAAGYVIVPAVIHGSHNRPGAALGSLGLRLALPYLGAIIGPALTCPSSDHFCSSDNGTIGGFLVGVAGASAIDASLLAWATPNATASTSAGQRVGLAPMLSVAGKPAGVRLIGTF